jgi:ssDNA-binding replication factor A large subunit
MDENYDNLLERISKSSGESIEELGRKVEAKRAKLSGLISKEGAAQIVAAEIGVSFESERMKISELVHGMKRVNVIGKVTGIFPVREFKKQEREGKIGSFLLGDESSNIRVVCWDMSHIDLIEKGEIKEGDVLEISNGAMRNGEMHLSGFSDIKHSTEKIEGVKTDREFAGGKLKDASPGKNMKVRAVIVQMFEPRQFESKQKPGTKGVLLNLVLDDGTETIRSVLFNENIKKLGISDEEAVDLEKFGKKKEELLGEEKFFSGNFRMNAFFNRTEMSIDSVEDIDVDELVKDLESKV